MRGSIYCTSRRSKTERAEPRRWDLKFTVTEVPAHAGSFALVADRERCKVHDAVAERLELGKKEDVVPKRHQRHLQKDTGMQRTVVPYCVYGKRPGMPELISATTLQMQNERVLRIMSWLLDYVMAAGLCPHLVQDAVGDAKGDQSDHAELHVERRDSLSACLHADVP